MVVEVSLPKALSWTTDVRVTDRANHLHGLEAKRMKAELVSGRVSGS